MWSSRSLSIQRLTQQKQLSDYKARCEPHVEAPTFWDLDARHLQCCVCKQHGWWHCSRQACHATHAKLSMQNYCATKTKMQEVRAASASGILCTAALLGQIFQSLRDLTQQFQRNSKQQCATEIKMPRSLLLCLASWRSCDALQYAPPKTWWAATSIHTARRTTRRLFASLAWHMLFRT